MLRTVTIKLSDIICLDSTKVFDKVPHRHLLTTLLHYGIGGHIHKWIITNKAIHISVISHVIVPYTATSVYQGSSFQKLLKDWNISPIAIPN